MDFSILVFVICLMKISFLLIFLLLHMGLVRITRENFLFVFLVWWSNSPLWNLFSSAFLWHLKERCSWGKTDLWLTQNNESCNETFLKSFKINCVVDYGMPNCLKLRINAQAMILEVSSFSKNSHRSNFVNVSKIWNNRRIYRISFSFHYACFSFIMYHSRV